MHNRFLKICSFLAACFFVTTCNAAAREDTTSGADKGSRKLSIIRPAASPVEYHVRVGEAENHLRIIRAVRASEDDELDGSLSEETPTIITIPRPIEGTWRVRSHSEKFGVRIFRGGVGELRFTEDGYGVQPVFLLRQHAFTSRSFYPQKLENEHDTGDLIVRSVALAKEIFPCMNLDTEGFVSNHLALCPFDTDYSKFYPPFLTLPHNMTSSGVDALYFLHKGFGLQGSHEFAKFLANCTGNIKARTLVYVNKNSRQFESGKMDDERRIAEGISEPIKVIVSYPLTQPIPVLAIQGNNYMIFGSKEIRVVLEEMVDQDSSGETFSWIRINVFPSLWDPSTKRQLFEIDEFLKFCRSGRINLGH